jgi:hypothetical protein
MGLFSSVKGTVESVYDRKKYQKITHFIYVSCIKRFFSYIIRKIYNIIFVKIKIFPKFPQLKSTLTQFRIYLTCLSNQNMFKNFCLILFYLKSMIHKQQ